MPKSKTLQIDNKEITITELRVREILEIFDEFAEDTDLDVLKNQGEKLLSKIAGLTLEDLKQMYPSDIKQIYDAFSEVNSFFFETVKNLGLDKLIPEITQSLAKDLSELCSDLLKPDTETSGSIAIPIS